MRYVFFAAVIIVNLIFTGAVFPNINIAGIYPDLIMCTVISISLIEKSMAGAMVGLISGLVLDLFFSGTIGLYALPYFIVGAATFFIAKNLKYIDRFLLPISFVIGGYFLKEIISSLLVYMLGVDFTFTRMFVRFMLPEAFMTGLLMLLIHLLFLRIFRSSSMKLKSSDDFKHL